MWEQCPISEHKDERGQEHGERDYPEEWDGSYVCSQIAGKRYKQTGWHKCKSRPANPLCPSEVNSSSVFNSRHCWRRRFATRPGKHTTGRYEQRKQQKTPAPDAGLHGYSHHRLKYNRIGKECDERTVVGSAVQKIGVGGVRVTAVCKPGLQ